MWYSELLWNLHAYYRPSLSLLECETQNRQQIQELVPWKTPWKSQFLINLYWGKVVNPPLGNITLWYSLFLFPQAKVNWMLCHLCSPMPWHNDITEVRVIWFWRCSEPTVLLARVGVRCFSLQSLSCWSPVQRGPWVSGYGGESCLARRRTWQWGGYRNDQLKANCVTKAYVCFVCWSRQEDKEQILLEWPFKSETQVPNRLVSLRWLSSKEMN